MSRYYRSFLEESVITPSYPASLIHLWTFNNNAIDLIGGKNGTLIGGANYSSNYISFDGINDCCTFPTGQITLQHDFTINFWVNVTTNNINCTLDIGWTGGSKGTFLLMRDNKVQLLNEARSAYIASVNNFSLGVWNMVTLTHKFGTDYKIYLNGNYENIYSTSWNLGLDATSILAVGGSFNLNTYFSKELMKNLAIQNVQLSNSEISTLYSLGQNYQYL